MFVFNMIGFVHFLELASDGFRYNDDYLPCLPHLVKVSALKMLIGCFVLAIVFSLCMWIQNYMLDPKLIFSQCENFRFATKIYN